MENIHNTASLAAITAHNSRELTFTRGEAELFCMRSKDVHIDCWLKFKGNHIAYAGGVDFDALPLVQLFNTLPE